jgi:hypothetical protein
LAGAALIEGLTMRGGNADADGGGILIDNASPTISATTVMSNFASSGGGIAVLGGAPLIVASSIVSNTAMGGGGLLIAEGAQPTLRQSIVGGNQAYLFGGGLLVVDGSAPIFEGGAIRGNSAPSGGGLQVFDSGGRLTGVEISNNSAQSGFGGGAALRGAYMSFESCSFLSNTATHDGGGLIGEDSLPAIAGCTFSGNQAASGGGVYLRHAGGSLAHSLFANNAALEGSGGGVMLDHSAPVFDANRLTGNTAADNGGGLDISGSYCPIEGCSNPISVLIANSIVAQNSAGAKGAGIHIDTGSAPDIVNNTIVGNGGEGLHIDAYAQAGVTNTILVSNTVGLRALVPSAPSADYNLVWGNGGGNYIGLPPGSHDLSANPRFVNPGAGDYYLAGDSPAIDSGLNSAAPGSDYDGFVRPLVGRCNGQQISDIGAYEYRLPADACTTPTPTASPTLPVGPSATPTQSPTPSRTATLSTTATASSTRTATTQPSATATATASPTRTATPSATRTGTSTATGTSTRTPTASSSPTRTATATHTATASLTATRTTTGTATRSATPSLTPTETQSPTPTAVVYRLAMPVIVSNFLHPCVLHEPNDQLDMAWGPLAMGQGYQSYLCFFDPVDWYYFDAPRAGAIAVDLIVPERADLRLSLHNDTGALLAQSDEFGEGVNEHIITVVQSAGRFYVRVEPFTRRDPNQPYTLTVSFF